MAWIDRARIEVAKTAAQRLDQVWNGGWREIADTPRQFLLLRVHRERPPEKQVRQRTMQRRVPSLLRLPWQIDGR
jgi:hypothetical protein